MEMQKDDERKWYVLHFINRAGKPSPQKYIDNFNKEGHNLKLFAPIIRPAVVSNGKVVYREKLLTFYYVFVNGTIDEVKELCSRRNNDLSILLDRGSERRYASISDPDMESFKIYARANANSLPFFNIEDIELSEGDLVEIVGGEYDGLKGTFMPKSRSNKGNLVIAVTSAIGAVVWNVDAKCVRILEFAQDTRRQYDIVDSFIPKLLPVIRKFHDKAELDNKDKSLLNIFNQRMGTVTLSNRKAEAKLSATLMCVQYMLGDSTALRHTQERYESHKGALTNVWTLALIELIIGAVHDDLPRLHRSYQTLLSSTGTNASESTLTATQRHLLAEYRSYLPN